MFGNFGSVDRGAAAYAHAQANGVAEAFAKANGTAYAQAQAYGGAPVAAPRAAGRGFALIIVLFILLVIIGTSWIKV